MKQVWYSIPGGILTSLPQTNWHDWFAWYPIHLTEGENSGKRIWWKWVERKIKQRTYDDDYYYQERK